jgi:hypothetical protein
VKALLKDLVDAGFLQEDWTPTRLLRSPYIYMLGQQTIEYLRDTLRWDVPDSFRASKEVGKSYLYIQHRLGLTDVVIAAALLKWEAPGYHLETFTSHRELAQNPYYTLWQGHQYGLVPDAFLEFRQALLDGKQRRTAVLLEFDRSTEERKQFRRKIRAYIAFLKAKGYKEKFNANSMTVAFATFEGEKRREQMREWAKQELEGEPSALGATFLFTAQPQPPDPRHIWLNPCWYTPYMEDKPVALLAEE